MGYYNCATIAATRGATKRITSPRELVKSLVGQMVRTARSYLPQITIGLLVLAASVCVTYYYYYID